MMVTAIALFIALSAAANRLAKLAAVNERRERASDPIVRRIENPQPPVRKNLLTG